MSEAPPLVAHVKTIAFKGIEAIDVDLQVIMTNAMPAFQIVGLPDKAVGESRERVRAALIASAMGLPNKRITVNLSPADLLKEGSHYDLPLALGLLCAMGMIDQELLHDFYVMGELRLDGTLSEVAGILPAAIRANASDKGLICPQYSYHEAKLSGLSDIIAAPHIMDILRFLKDGQRPPIPQGSAIEQQDYAYDFNQVKGQDGAVRAMEICAAGGHNILLSGPPGAGKSLLASCLPTILPPMTSRQALEVTLIHSLAGHLLHDKLSQQRPFRDPHHTASMVALSGGGANAKPGELSLAHHGVLFLDELPEFSRQALEVLRQPLETGSITIARANHHVTYPAEIQLVAAMNPCRCGYLGDPERMCHRAPKCGVDYQAKISGPLLDRFDLYLDVKAVSARDLIGQTSSHSSQAMREKITQVRQFQYERNQKFGQLDDMPNAALSGKMVEEYITLNTEAQNILRDAIDRMDLTARGYHRILRVARTIADMEFQAEIAKHHLLEAISYRQLPGRI
jgi:magnesium chelatase family protein